ncbi:MAG: hypothetical protein UDK34_01970 [Cyanobacteriota bacterium]|nr:hypothetical protein [Cyanobacteriota bacterium]
MLIYKTVENGWYKKVKILGITTYKRDLINFRNKPYCEHKYLKALFKVVENKNEKHYYLFGIELFKYIKPVTYDMINDIINEKCHLITDKLDNIYYDMHVLNQISVLHKDYLQYKRCYEGRDIVLVATGPTSQYYKKLIQNAVHIGINSAIKYDWIDFDYIFVNDNSINNPELNYEIDRYKPKTCKKFYAIPSQRRLNINRNKYKMAIDKISQDHFYLANAMPYLLEDRFCERWGINLECEPFGDFGGSVFSALQFACYTHPKKIYIVGCDMGRSYSGLTQKEEDYSPQLHFWALFKDFVTRVYPDIEIITINPVGLKGVFSETYTKEYMDSIDNKDRELI